ncbi:colicin I receptor precursor [bacterium BMS3Bbin14]|nr:colicin I receptor precursor [bacterium BMS3Bbin14]
MVWPRVSCMFAVAFLGMLVSAASVGAAGGTGAVVITGDEIKEMNVHKIADVLNQVPGIKAGESSVSIRGSYKVKVLLDGRPINDPSSSHGSVKFDLVDVENVAEIQIYKGKGALQYGDDAGGGVILITTRKIKALSGNVKAYWGNYDTSHYNANCSVRKGAFGLGATAGYDYTGGYQVNGDRQKRQIGGRFEYVPGNGRRLAFSADYLKDKRGLSGRPEFPTPRSRKESEMFSCALTARAGEVASETFFNDAKTRNRDPDRNIDNFITVRKFGEDLSASLAPARYGTVHYGTALRWSGAKSSRFAARNESSLSLFATDAVSIRMLATLPVTLSFGLRATLYSEFAHTVNPEAKISYKKDRWSLSVSGSRTNNIPSFYQRYDETGTKEPNPGLGMERADNFSISFFTEISPRLSGGVSLFYNRIADRITYVLGDNGIGRYENFGEVTNRGGDLLLNWKLRDNLSLKATYMYIKSIDEDTGLWMVAKPRHRVYADLAYKPVENLSFIFNLKYESGQYTRSDNTASIPGRIIGNLRVEYNPVWPAGRFGRPEFFGEIKNIGDRTYRYGDGWLAPPRTWIFGLNLNL